MWTRASAWEFEPLDDEAFPAVELAQEVGRARKTYPAVYNAANEEAVDAFRAGELSFVGIVDTIEATAAPMSVPATPSREATRAALTAAPALPITWADDGRTRSASSSAISLASCSAVEPVRVVLMVL